MLCSSIFSLPISFLLASILSLSSPGTQDTSFQPLSPHYLQLLVPRSFHTILLSFVLPLLAYCRESRHGGYTSQRSPQNPQPPNSSESLHFPSKVLLPLTSVSISDLHNSLPAFNSTTSRTLGMCPHFGHLGSSVG